MVIVKLGVSILCAAVLLGCSEGFDPGPVQTPAQASVQQSVREISYLDAKKCRLIMQVTGIGYAEAGQDGMDNAKRNAASLASAKGGNALLIVSYTSKSCSEADKPTQFIVKGNAYSCA